VVGVCALGFTGDLSEFRAEMRSKFTERFALLLRQCEDNLRSNIKTRESGIYLMSGGAEVRAQGHLWDWPIRLVFGAE
jgi:hypothetical protein